MSFDPPIPETIDNAPRLIPRPRGLVRAQPTLSRKSKLVDDQLHVTSHEFKTHMAQYLRLLEQEPAINCIVLKQYKKGIALIVPLGKS